MTGGRGRLLVPLAAAVVPALAAWGLAFALGPARADAVRLGALAAVAIALLTLPWVRSAVGGSTGAVLGASLGALLARLALAVVALLGLRAIGVDPAASSSALAGCLAVALVADAWLLARDLAREPIGV